MRCIVIWAAASIGNALRQLRLFVDSEPIRIHAIYTPVQTLQVSAPLQGRSGTDHPLYNGTLRYSAWHCRQEGVQCWALSPVFQDLPEPNRACLVGVW